MIDVPASYLISYGSWILLGPYVNRYLVRSFWWRWYVDCPLVKKLQTKPSMVWLTELLASALLPLEGLAMVNISRSDRMAIRLAKMVRALLINLRANGTHTYLATVEVYGPLKMANSDLTNLDWYCQVTIQPWKEMATIPLQQGQINTKPLETGSTGMTERCKSPYASDK